MATTTLNIAGKVYEVENIELDQSELNFYIENPRVYSILRLDGTEPSQEEIEAQMKKNEHVRKLRLAIETNGGLIDPLIVRKKDMVVLEGNSRLAAYRILCEKNPVQWGKVKCVLLPDEVDEDAIFALLGQYHIVGRKDWSPYEQAGYLYRRRQKTKLPVEAMAKELGIAESEAKRVFQVYEFMIKNNVLDPDKWSYYDEMLHNRGIKNQTKKDPKFYEKVTEKIQSGKIGTAQDIRKLGDIVKSDTTEAQEIAQDFMDDKISLEKAHVSLQESGILNDDIERLAKFREVISATIFTKKVLESNDEVKDKAKYELTQIKNIIENILQKIS